MERLFYPYKDCMENLSVETIYHGIVERSRSTILHASSVSLKHS